MARLDSIQPVERWLGRNFTQPARPILAGEPRLHVIIFLSGLFGGNHQVGASTVEGRLDLVISAMSHVKVVAY